MVQLAALREMLFEGDLMGLLKVDIILELPPNQKKTLIKFLEIL